MKSTNQQKNNDEATRNEILNINSVEDKKNQKIMGENDGHNQNKKTTTIIADDHIPNAKMLIALFLNVLFNKTQEKIRVKGVYMNHKELWKFIRDEVGNYYEIESKEILPKTKTFSYNLFLANKDEKKKEEYICNYSQLIINRNLQEVENFDKFMLFRFFYERISKVNNFTLWYVVYFKELKQCYLPEYTNVNKGFKAEKEDNSGDSDSNKDEKSKKNVISNKNNECLELYEHIYNQFENNDINYKNTRYDLSGLLYQKDDGNNEDDQNTNKNVSCSLYMQKMFSRLGYLMIHLAKDINNIEEEDFKLHHDEDGMNLNLDLTKNKSDTSLSNNDLNMKNNQNSIKVE